MPSVRGGSRSVRIVTYANVASQPGTFTASAGQAVDVTCHQGVGTGEITLTDNITAVQVS